jgi:hypothetical protein
MIFRMQISEMKCVRVCGRFTHYTACILLQLIAIKLITLIDILILIVIWISIVQVM